MWLGAANGACSEHDRDRGPKQGIERQEDVPYVGMALRADNRKPRVCAGCASGSKQYCWD
jgi:hypothetical protein